MQGDFDLRGTIQELTSPEALGELLARLGYSAEQPRQLTAASMQLSVGVAEGVREIQQVAVGRDQDRFRIHFYHLRKVNRTILSRLTAHYNGLEGETLLIVTSDWERIDVVLPRGKQLLVQTLDRLKPSQVHQRFVAQLRWRGPTFADQASYLAKIFEAAEWADELFNNRALFSNHVLETRLRERPEWGRVPEVYWRDLTRIFRETQEDRRTVQVLEKLGFERPGNQSDVLSGPGGAVALFEVAAWGKPLDVRDSAEAEVATIPGIRAVARLEQAEDGPGWLILTNGELWRLYSRDAHSRATNYYEIDLNGLLAGTGPGEVEKALRYFWVLFRREAFEKSLESDRAGQREQESLLDWLFRESIDYAKKLGDRLKDKVFEDVFSILADGFLAADTRPRPLNGEALDEAFRGTLTFLYRLLFLFYAEARDLLPVREHRDYYQKSLRKLCEEVAARAGAAQSDFDRKLGEVYRDNGFELFERLRELFLIVDRGSAEHNVPAYNGGLFLTSPDLLDTRPEAEAARFLQAHPLHDRALARALDRLARDEDARRAELVKVDYRSLGVRQLGSIYEGLLEFRLREAHEPLAIVKGKKTEEVVRLSEALKDKLKILKLGKGKEAVERILQPGTFYLENDRGERRATGSFYTPDFVVEYIVEKAVGPLLDEKLEGLRERLREAERWRIRQKKQAPAKGEDPQKYESGPAVEGQFASLVKDFFDFKVLDPAMGSGHFLVEAVDFITDRMLRFLSQFPWNPVSCHLAELRKEISAALTKQGITVNESRLTDVNLLKRHVLKRCIYGVDRNPMAVELAKVSLWLDCFTLGAPLSFLDHHLRCGNSLLGAEVEEVRQKVDSQLQLWGSSFAGLQLAKASMVLVGGLPDVTTEQIHQSQTAFEAAMVATLPFRRILDLYLSGSFLKEAAKPGKKQAKGDSEVVTFLQTQGHEVLGEVDPGRFEARLATLSPAVRAMVKEGLAIAEAERFFHWELELPEAFFEEHQDRRGFDVVVGNPPWIRQESLKRHKKAFERLYEAVYAAEADIYVYFIALAAKVLRPSGNFGMILQNKWLKAHYAGKLRQFLLTALDPSELLDFGHAPLFDDTDTFPCVLLANKSEPGRDSALEFVEVAKAALPIPDLADYVRHRKRKVKQSRLGADSWQFLGDLEAELAERIATNSAQLEQVLKLPLYGIKTGLNASFIVSSATRARLIDQDSACSETLRPILRGEDLRRWQTDWAGNWLIEMRSSNNRLWPWSDSKTSEQAEVKFAASLPSIYSWLKPQEDELRARSDSGSFWWELRSCDYWDAFRVPKIIYKDLAFHSEFSLDSEGFTLNDLCFFVRTTDKLYLAMLNSSVAWWYLSRVTVHAKDEALRLKSDKMAKLPIAVNFPSALAAQVRGTAEEVFELAAEYKRQCNDASGALEGFGSRRTRTRNGEQVLLLPRHHPVRDSRVALLKAECRLQSLVAKCYGISDSELNHIQQLSNRDPLALFQAELRKLGEEP